MVRKYIEKIAEHQKQEDMVKLGDMLADALYKLKKYDEACFKSYEMKLYTMAYGDKFTDEMAEKVVSNMKPYHVHWTKEQTNQVMRNAGLNFDENDFYVVMNMAYNDYHELFDDDVDSYIRFTSLYLNDPDGKPNKAFKNLA